MLAPARQSSARALDSISGASTRNFGYRRRPRKSEVTVRRRRPSPVPVEMPAALELIGYQNGGKWAAAAPRKPTEPWGWASARRPEDDPRDVHLAGVSRRPHRHVVKSADTIVVNATDRARLGPACGRLPLLRRERGIMASRPPSPTR